MMKCPECGKEMAKGYAKASNGNSLTDAFTFMTWYPEDQKGKLFKNGAVNLRLKNTAYYCDECMKVFAEFEEK